MATHNRLTLGYFLIMKEIKSLSLIFYIKPCQQNFQSYTSANVPEMLHTVTYCHLYPAPLDTEIIFGRPLQCFYSLLSLQREISRSVCREKLNQKVRTIPLSSRNNYLPMTQFRTWSEVNDPLIDLSAVFF